MTLDALDIRRDLDPSIQRTFEQSLIRNAPRLLHRLTEQCTLHSAQIELAQSLRLARNLERLACASPAGRQNPAGTVYTFLPRNNLLYSIALYCLIPLSLGLPVQARTPAALSGLVTELWQLTGLDRFDSARLRDESQRDFTSRSSSEDVLIFTGRSENGRRVEAQTAHRAFIGFGSSLNPAIVMPGADLEKACDDLVFARLYNSGADCLAPDSIFVHASVYAEFHERLTARLTLLDVADRRSAGTIAHAPSPDMRTATQGREFLSRMTDRTTWSGPDFDAPDFVPTTVTTSDLDEATHVELFSPVFNIVTFSSWERLLATFGSEPYRGSEMYLSLYGEAGGPLPDAYRLCASSTPFHHEAALRPFGGYGADATWLTIDGTTTGRPVSVFHTLRSELCA